MRCKRTKIVNTMHDPKLSAAVAHHHLLLSESLADKLPSSHHHLRQHSHLSNNPVDYIHQQHNKAAMYPRTNFSSVSSPYQEGIRDSRSHGRLLPLFHRLKDIGSSSNILQYPSYESAFSEVASQYRYSDLLHARRLYESLYGDQTLPLSFSAISRRLAGSGEYAFPGQGSTLRSSVVIKDVSDVPSSISLQMPSISLSTSSSSPARLLDTLSLSPLHVSTTVSSSPLSSESSPSPLRRSSVSPDSRWKDTQLHQHPMPRPSLISSLSLPGDLALYEERALHDRTFPPSALTSPCSFPSSLWHPSSSLTLYGPGPPPLLCACTPQAAAFDSRPSIGHLLNHYTTSPPTLAHHHLHHHLSRQHLVRDSFYSGSASGSLDTRSSPGKELPTKLLKQDRVRGRQDLNAALEADKEHAERLNNLKKSASTQTQFSSFNCENLPPPPYYTAHDTVSADKLLTNSTHAHSYPSHLPPPHLPPSFVQYSHATSSYHGPQSATSSSSSHTPSVPGLPPHPSSFHTTALLSPPQAPSKPALAYTSPSPPATPTLPPPPLTQIGKGSPPSFQPLPPYPSAAHGCSPPPPPQYPSRGHLDEQHTPLNLSLSNTPPSSSLISQTRPSTVAGLSSPQAFEHSESSRGGAEPEEATKARFLSDKNGTNHDSKAQVSDEAIEEHFRRSLGKSYHEPSPPKKVAVHVSEKICSVDDHFARALGDQMWTEIKARSEPPSFDSLPGSVDAHFAKALGAAMWKKLKAENKVADDVITSNSMQAQPQQLEDQPNQPKSPPSSPLQKPLIT